MSRSEFFPRLRRRLAALLRDRFGIEIRRLWPPRLIWKRWEYQQHIITRPFPPGTRVLDIGSGGDPFPHATVLADRFLQPNAHRTLALVRDARPLVQADADALPFADKNFDFVVCSHLLEHQPDPVRTCREIMRVGRAGYVETPTYSTDILFAWAKGMHRWHIVSIADSLVFFEYTDRQLEGIRSTAWKDVVNGPYEHPLQQAFYNNMELFNMPLLWEDHFRVYVFRLDGSLERFEPC